MSRNLRAAAAVLFSTIVLACATKPPKQADSHPEDDAAACSPGTLPDAGRCVTSDPPCPEKMHLEYGQGCVRDDSAPIPAPSGLAPVPVADLVVDDLVVGTGARAEVGSTIVVHYVGSLESGQPFDSSVERGRPFEAQLGKGMLIKGWEEGIVGMRVGGRRKLRIAASKGYGERGHPPKIPGNATLFFEIELLGVK